MNLAGAVAAAIVVILVCLGALAFTVTYAAIEVWNRVVRRKLK